MKRNQILDDDSSAHDYTKQLEELESKLNYGKWGLYGLTFYFLGKLIRTLIQNHSEEQLILGIIYSGIFLAITLFFRKNPFICLLIGLVINGYLLLMTWGNPEYENSSMPLAFTLSFGVMLYGVYIAKKRKDLKKKMDNLIE